MVHSCHPAVFFLALVLVEIELTQRLSFWRVLSLFQRLGKLFLEKIALVLFRFHRLPEDGFLALVLLVHSLCRRGQIFESALTRSRSVADQGPGIRINTQHRGAVGASDFKYPVFLSSGHFWN